MPLSLSLSDQSRDVAVVDVGSNSIRLVIYRLEGRSIWAVFNEKVLAGLGRDLKSTGRLSVPGVTQAMTALRRFKAVLDAAQPAEIFATATAAVRDATDGAAFTRRVADEVGLTLRLLAGEEEARYAALGVLAGAPQTVGVVGDLGGASLELTRVAERDLGPGVTLPLGPFSAVMPDSFLELRVRQVVEQQLAPQAQRFRTEIFHAVGGAWRNLALIYMRMSRYPLQIVHQFEMSRREALEACCVIARQSRNSLERIDGVSKRRLETIPHAAVVLEGLIDALEIQTVVLSAYGLREGLIFESMSPVLQALDPLIEGCASLGGHRRADRMGTALTAWLTPVFAQLPPMMGWRESVLIAAAARLADLGARLHPDHRPDLVFEQVLRAPVAGQSHAERAFLAVAAFARHSSGTVLPEAGVISKLLTDDQVQRARAIGAAIRLGFDLSGRSPALLAESRLSLEAGQLRLQASPPWSDMLLSEQTTKRAVSLSHLLGLNITIGTA